MNRLVVLFWVVAAATAAPHVAVPASTTLLHQTVGIAAAPAVVAAAPALVRTADHVVVGQSVAAVAPAVSVSHGIAPAVVRTASPVAISAHQVAVAPVAVAPVAVAPVAVARAPIVVPQPPRVVETQSIGHVLTKNVHYAPQPVVTGYTSSVIKPDLGSIATPHVSVSQTPVAAPARAVDTIVPQITQVQPELRVQKVAVDVPVATPVVSEVEVRTPVVQAAPVVAQQVVATPVAQQVVAARVAQQVVAAPVAQHVVAAPIAQQVVATPVAQQVVATHGIVGVPAATTRLVGTTSLVAAPVSHGIIAPHGVVATHGVVAPHGVVATQLIK